MKTSRLHTLLAAVALTSCLPLQAADTVIGLRYSWADSPTGPWTPVPREAMEIGPDGSARILSTKGLKFFRADTSEGGATGALPVVPLSSVDPALQEEAKIHLEAIRTGEGSEEEAAHWKGARLSPLAVPVFSPWNTSGKPDALELKILPPAPEPPGPGLLPSPERPTRTALGYLMLGVSDELPSMVEFVTDGQTMSEQLLARCGGKPVSRIVRYAPTFIVAEDESGDAVGSLGHYPVLRTDAEYTARAVRRSIHSVWDNPVRLTGFDPQPEPPSFATYRQFRTAYLGSIYLAQRREWRKELLAFDRLAATGRAPAITLKPGDRVSELTDEKFTEFVLDSEEEREVPATIALPLGGGVTIVARNPGSWRLTLRRSDGTVVRRMLNITSPVRGGAGEPKLVSKTWNAINSADQPRYQQYKDSDTFIDADWCPVVGCGPVALQMLFSWWDRTKGVTSLYYKRGGTSTSFLESLRAADAPLESSEYDGTLMRWYDFWNDTCNVYCLFGSGATPPENLGSAFVGYIETQASALFAIGTGAPGPLIGYEWHWEADVISDDWDESGIELVKEIKAGRPGIVLYYELVHYMMAYRYKRWRYEIPGSPWQPGWFRAFKCNMGWGNTFNWVNAYDIDGCWLGRFWQKNLPPAPQ